jgi:aquaporin Z
MVSAAFFTTILEYPRSALHRGIPNDFLRLCLIAVAMGATATILIYSPMGKRSGAHMNPAITLAFLRLGKINKYDAFYYVIFQTLGGIVFVFLMVALMGEPLKAKPVNYVITEPGKYGVMPAFITEIIIAFGMMTMVLITSQSPKTSRFTGAFAGFFVTGYVILSGPISGFGMNPARSIASAVPAMQFPSFWIYLTAPFIGMFGAAELLLSLKKRLQSKISGSLSLPKGP